MKYDLNPKRGYNQRRAGMTLDPIFAFDLHQFTNHCINTALFSDFTLATRYTFGYSVT
ncbi:hypothetical protein M2333_000229 [Sphingobium sp. B11D3B]|uniref:hypothetical protein n=1 Tax=Sphingobium sp. B11D3B TaxID=2940575 RepID=UPI002225D82F|nr:hypothetical protein [Sphingobium sp. B11D3B]MCW2387183.1 hypothetical protein [Sphingobium sp. B11D3B]